MAGSKKNFVYTTDTGDQFAILQDESNGEALANADYTGADSTTYFLPRNITPRYAMYRSSDGNYQRKIVVTSNTANATTLPGTVDFPTENDGNVTMSLTLYVGERFKVLPKAADSGLTDGDPT